MADCLYFFPNFFSIIECIASIGNSINGPITNTNEIIGCEGNVIVAIASEIGEFRADVVKMSGTIFLNGNFNITPVIKAIRKIITKNNSSGGSNFVNNMILPSNNVP